MVDLQTALLDLLSETDETDLRLILGGGYGLFLKGEQIRETGDRTLFAAWPAPRSTNDLDLFLRPELLIDAERLRPLAEALNRLGYKPIPGAEKYQFMKPGPAGDRVGELKIDVLTGPRSCFDNTAAQVDARRVRPQPSVGVHAHPVNEACTLEVQLIPCRVRGTTSAGQVHEGVVYLPHPFTFLMMKLFALRDRASDPGKDYGRHHALDLYTVVAMMTEPEWNQALALQTAYATEPAVREASQIVTEYFASSTSQGTLRLRESPYFRPDFPVTDFCETLRSLFP